MVSNAVYAELKRRKGSSSFSETIAGSLKNDKAKTVEELREVAGMLKGDTEYDEVMTYSRKKWKEWQDNFYKKEGYA